MVTINYIKLKRDYYFTENFCFEEVNILTYGEKTPKYIFYYDYLYKDIMEEEENFKNIVEENKQAKKHNFYYILNYKDK